MQCLFALSEDQRSRRCGEKHMSETVTGYIDHVIFRNEDNGYTVMVLKGTKKEEELTCVGSFPAITQGASIEATGVYIHHPVYGKQFQISSFTEKMPEDTYGIERYLGSGAIRGIGAALAARIVRKFGDDTLRIVEEEPERLAEVKGISEKKAREIAAQVSEKAEMRKVMIFLQKYGISLNLGAKIYQKYKESVYTILQENPYRLAEDISGVGFKIADEIAARVGIHATQITESAAECCILFCRLREKDILIFRGNSYLQDVPDFWEWMNPIWRNTLWIWLLTGSWC